MTSSLKETELDTSFSGWLNLGDTIEEQRSTRLAKSFRPTGDDDTGMELIILFFTVITLGLIWVMPIINYRRWKKSLIVPCQKGDRTHEHN